MFGPDRQEFSINSQLAVKFNWWEYIVQLDDDTVPNRQNL